VNNITLVGFEQATLVNDMMDLIRDHNLSVAVLDPSKFLNNEFEKNNQFIVAVYKDLKLRQEISKKLDKDVLSRATFIHRTAVVSCQAVVRPGNFISQFSNVMMNATVESDCHLAPYTMIAHNSTLGQGSIMLPNAMIAGSSRIGQFCRLNMRSTVIDFLEVKDFVEIGAGSMLTKHALDSGFYVGTPARKKN
jgi:UDP-3-O-[3-hydroxymyristoyl] glucosamine N-acyltransferase